MFLFQVVVEGLIYKLILFLIKNFFYFMEKFGKPAVKGLFLEIIFISNIKINFTHFPYFII